MRMRHMTGTEWEYEREMGLTDLGPYSTIGICNNILDHVLLGSAVPVENG